MHKVALLLALICAPVMADDHCDKPAPAVSAPSTPSASPVVAAQPERHHGRHDYGWLAAGAVAVGVGLVWHFDRPHNVPAEKQDATLEYGVHIYSTDGN